MTIMYHVSNMNFIIGQEILPGNFWKRMEETDSPNDFKTIIIELIFEGVRREINNQSVSRKSCVFAFKKIEDARLFLKMYRNGPQMSIYEIEVAENTPIFEGDFSIITYITPFKISKISEAAGSYWSGIRHTSFIETLIGGSVKIIRKVE